MITERTFTSGETSSPTNLPSNVDLSATGHANAPKVGKQESHRI